MLNQELYDRLRRVFGQVKVYKRGVSAVFRTTKSLNGTSKVLLDGGETYVVCCPFCNDRRFRLYFSHIWGQKDKSGKPDLRFVHCFNEDCVSDPERKRRLYEIIHLPPRQRPKFIYVNKMTEVPKRPEPIKLPKDFVLLSDLPEDHPVCRYVSSRGFRPEYLAETFRVGTFIDGPRRGLLPKVVIPFIFNDDVYGWQERAIDDSVQPKYLTLPAGFKKSLFLYNYSCAMWFPLIVVCEGVFDVFRVGPAAVALLGKTISDEQVKLLEKAKKPVAVFLDGDADVSVVMDRLQGRVPLLSHIPLPPDTDPADLSADEIRQLISPFFMEVLDTIYAG